MSDTLVATPASTPAESPATPDATPATPAKRSAKRTARPAAITPDAAFRAAFGRAVNVPGWFAGMVAAVVAAYRAVPADKRSDFAACRDAARTAVNRIAGAPESRSGHAFTGNGPAGIAATQNALYVAFAASGIVRRDVPNAFGAAMWAAVIPGAKCDYGAHADYFASTMGAFVGGRHGDAPGLPRDAAVAMVRTWANAARS